MRDPAFKAKHRGGLLSDTDHRLLMQWALAMTEHLALYLTVPVEPILIEVLEVGRQWSEGRAGTGEAMKASRAVHKHAQSIADPVYKLFCRSVGHAVATAHMADHSLGPVHYGTKLVNLLGFHDKQELAWQLAKLQELCPSLVPIVEQALEQKLRLQLQL
ncbi:MAG: hypothetical protein VB088_00090 [Sphaerochaeta sp.]|nr:hypothetical protein [Sphaerochaeta sp.]